MLDTSYKRMIELIGRKLSLEKFEQVLIDLGFELDAVDGDSIRVEITHDRVDCVSPQGLARTVRTFLGIDKGLKEYKVVKTGHELRVNKNLKGIRPYAVSCIIKGLKFTDDLIKETIFVQEKLTETYGRKRKKAGIGIYPLKDIKPPIDYIAKDPNKVKFIPLEFTKELTAKQILTNHPTGRTYAHLLEGFSKYPFFIDSANNVLSMPPIINSQTFGKIDENTTDVFVEVAGTDWKTVNEILTIIATMFAESGGVIHQMKIITADNKVHYAPMIMPEKWLVNPEEVTSLLGLKFSNKEIITLLNRMGMDSRVVKGKIEVLVPFYRTDILHPVDIIDDLARAYGFNNFEPEIPSSATIGGLLPRTVFNNRVRELMIGHGLLEVFTKALTRPEDQFDRMNLARTPHISTVKTKCADTVLRTLMLPELMKCFESNIHGDYPQRIYEVNDVVLLDASSDVKSHNETHLCVASCGTDSGFTEAKQYLESLKNNFGLDFKLKEKDYKFFIKGRGASIISKGKEVGFIGEIHPQVISNFGLKFPVAAFEINLESFY